MNGLLQEILPGILSAIFASYLTARWSMKKFFLEKWWERKERVYSEIITCIYDIMEYYEFKRDYYKFDQKFSQNRAMKIEPLYRDAYWKLKKVTDVGSFVISIKAVIVLKDLQSRPQLDFDYHEPWEMYENDYLYHKQALEKIVEIANKELKANRF